MRFVIEDISETIIPKVYLLKARSEDGKVLIAFEIPLRLQDMLNFKQGDKLSMEIDKKELEDVKDDDLYMTGWVFAKTERKLMVSIGGLRFSIEGQIGELLDKFNLMDKVYVRIRKIQ